MEISKADWKLYRERVSEWQEHYMEKLAEDYVKLLTSPGNASDHFWELKQEYEEKVPENEKDFGKKVSNEKRISFEKSEDPFYSDSNIQYLENIVRDIKDGKVHFAEHDLIDVD